MFHYQHIKKHAKAGRDAMACTFGRASQHMQKYRKKPYPQPFRPTFIIY